MTSSSVIGPWDTVPTVRRGVSNVSLRTRYPDGMVIPVAVPADATGRTYRAAVEQLVGYVVEGIIVNGVLTVVED